MVIRLAAAAALPLLLPGAARAGGAAADLDQDGFSPPEDCDDDQPYVHPQAFEFCDGLDNDCDEAVDRPECALDQDGDGWAPADGDCDDAQFWIYPFAFEFCDGLDNDCDGAVDRPECVDDLDGDGWTPGDGDCSEGDFWVHPYAYEYCDGVDNDCDGAVDQTVVVVSPEGGEQPDPAIDCGADLDGDGWTPDAGDCSEGDPWTYPGAWEYCDGADNDCSGVADDVPGCEQGDQDGDGWPVPQDCDDFDFWVHPFAEEICDGRDTDCDGLGDPPGCDEPPPPGDEDRDGWPFPQDCDDSDPWVNPAAPELCDGRDNDCDGTVDKEECRSFDDRDADGAAPWQGDCDDENPYVRPGGFEYCDGLDNDCDGAEDEDCGESGCADLGGGAITFGMLLLVPLPLRRRFAGRAGDP